MRAFLTFCLIAVSASEQLGYNYNPSSILGGSGYSGFGGSLSSGGGGFGSGSLGSAGVLGSGGFGAAGGIGSGSYSNGGGFGSGGFGSAGGIGSSPFSNGGGYSGYSAPAPVITELSKEYFFHAAPEEAQDAGNGPHNQSILKKNLRVVFIKAPENNGLANAALQAAKQATEDQTAIYVLTQQADVSDITKQLQQASQVHSKKPEVHFVKYRTPEDALNAQQSIQAQYDALGGKSKSSNEGVAPVLDYASSNLGSPSQASGSYSPGLISAPSGLYSAPSGIGSISAPSNAYLAPKSSYLPPVSF